jgi:trk system potassium uptake protein TrkA
MDVEVLERAGVAEADAAVVATNGDNTNIVVAQVLRARWEVPCVVVRILDPARAAFYAERGLRTVCPTQTAIASITDEVRASTGAQAT